MKLTTDKATLISATGGGLTPDNRAQRDVATGGDDAKHHQQVPGNRAQRGAVVVRYQEVLGKYYVCHAGSYQNAFGGLVNGFDTRELAEAFARERGCTVERHRHDQLQASGNRPKGDAKGDAMEEDKSGDAQRLHAQRLQDESGDAKHLQRLRLRYCQLLKEHDWYHGYGEDQAVWRNGVKEREALLAMRPVVDPGFELWNAYAPKEFKR